ncbi:MAG TPA: CHASE3 domain-containing protein [Candidatus Xenobia bacterium]|jgi:methyl-accepting chemotaxis protein
MDWKIGRKLAAAFAFAIAIMVVQVVVALWNINQLAVTAGQVDRSEQTLQLLEDVYSAALNAETGQRGFLLTGREDYLEPYTTGVTRLDNDLARLRQTAIADPRAQRGVDDLAPQVEAKKAELQATIELRRKGGLDAALPEVLTDRGKRDMDAIRRTLDDLEGIERDRLGELSQAADLARAEARNVLLLGMIIAISGVTLIGVAITRNITLPLDDLMRAVRRMESGELRQDKLPIRTQDELGQLVAAFNSMLASWRDLAGQSRTAAENISAAASQISASARQQSASFAEQLEAVQETTTTMDEVARSGAQIADKAKSVGSAAQATSTAMVTGQQAAQNTSRTMETIREQVEVVAENIVALSDKTQAIGDIIMTVNDIAERSNLLAFNAAIEAASVGEEGSRFAVVASELKNLADQAKQSTVQVRSLLGDIQKGIHSSVMLTEEAVKRVEAGRLQTESAESIIRQGSATTQESVQAFQQIVAATGQQQIGFEQVTIALQSIRTASQQNSQGITQLDMATANLSALSGQLRQAVERFSV